MDAVNLSHVWPNFPTTSAVTTKAPRTVPFRRPHRRLEELVTAQASPRSLQDRLLAEAVTAALERRVFEQWQAFEQERAQKVWATQTAALLAEV